LLIFGLYHLSLWFDMFRMRRMVFWRRVGSSSAIAHALFMGGLFVVFYLDYGAAGELVGIDIAFDAFLLNSTQFWQAMLLLDTLAAVTMIGILAALDYFGMTFGPIIPLTLAITLVLGTFQWYWIGGAIGAAFERLWTGLKGPEEEKRDWL